MVFVGVAVGKRSATPGLVTSAGLPGLGWPTVHDPFGSRSSCPLVRPSRSESRVASAADQTFPFPAKSDPKGLRAGILVVWQVKHEKVFEFGIRETNSGLAVEIPGVIAMSRQANRVQLRWKWRNDDTEILLRRQTVGGGASHPSIGSLTPGCVSCMCRAASFFLHPPGSGLEN